METKTWGDWIVADPATCHGEPTFRGKYIMVANVLKLVESGMAWEAIIEEWRYEIERDAIAKACSYGTWDVGRLGIPKQIVFPNIPPEAPTMPLRNKSWDITEPYDEIFLTILPKILSKTIFD
ncbi:MAG: DUF433 domain-containing protein [ANME-2 cluster archaeon]|jgi:uncharacterized protein (DUF433 family)|nr:DUF433 domain-containing protein [ANME-2 cluster archaeon]